MQKQSGRLIPSGYADPRPGPDEPNRIESLKPEQLGRHDRVVAGRRGRRGSRPGSQARPGRRASEGQPPGRALDTSSVRACLVNVVEREGIEVGPLRQYLPQLHVVLLARALQAGLRRIGAGHAGVTRPARAGLDLREVQELRAAVAQHHREDVFEGASVIGFHRVDCGLHVGLVLVLEQDEDLEEQTDEVEREDALRVAAKPLHAVRLDGEQLEAVW